MRPFRNVDDTLGVVYTHGFAGLAGGLLVGIFANSADGRRTRRPDLRRRAAPARVQAYTAAWVIVFSAIGTFILLKLVGLVVPLRMSEADMETGDIAVHGHEVYPSDVPSLGYPDGVPAQQPTAAGTGRRHRLGARRRMQTAEPPRALRGRFRACSPSASNLARHLRRNPEWH